MKAVQGTVVFMNAKYISRTFRFGSTDVDRLGFGAMRLSGQPGNFGPYRDPKQGIALVRAAHALGVRFFDSAWAYGPQTVDQLLGEAVQGKDAFIATKGGVDKTGPGQIVVDGPLGAHPMRPVAGLPAQDALAWLLRRADNIVVIPGTTSIAHLQQNWDTWGLVNAEPRKSS